MIGKEKRHLGTSLAVHWLKLSCFHCRGREFDPRFSSVQSLSCVWLFATPWTAARQTSLSITDSQILLKLMSIELVMPSSHLILCHPLILLPSIFLSIRVISNKLTLRIRWPKYWSFSFSTSPSSENSWMRNYDPSCPCVAQKAKTKQTEEASALWWLILAHRSHLHAPSCGDLQLQHLGSRLPSAHPELPEVHYSTQAAPLSKTAVRPRSCPVLQSRQNWKSVPIFYCGCNRLWQMLWLKTAQTCYTAV